MNIGLISVDSKILNLALMKLSAYHKSIGDNVEIVIPGLGNYDRVYSDKIVNFTLDYQYYGWLGDTEIIQGGSGYSLYKNLSPEIENQYPDYELFNCDYAMGFTTRGCIRNCPFCIVPTKEAFFTIVSDIYSFWNGQKDIVFLDNNILGCPEHFEKIALQTIENKIRVDFNQGLDIRLVTPEIAELLSKIHWQRFIRFSFDSVGIENQVRNGIELLKKYGVKGYRLFFYILIGFNTKTEEDLYRVELLRSFGCDMFVMPYNKKDPYQKRFARWVNHKAIFKTVSWNDYKG
jgi:hypothetical protein